MTLTEAYITATGGVIWVAPAGVTKVLLIGCGGGGGGAAGSGNVGGGGGAGAIQSSTWVTVVPNDSYTVTIGTGGTTTVGGKTTFGSLATFWGASSATSNTGGSCILVTQAGTKSVTTNATTSGRVYANGGLGGAALNTAGLAGDGNILGGFAGGTGGTSAASTGGGGGGGGAGPQGAGGGGSNGTNSSAASTGTSGAANTGAGGGGGGGTNSGTAGAAGSGGSGYCYIVWEV